MSDSQYNETEVGVDAATAEAEDDVELDSGGDPVPPGLYRLKVVDAFVKKEEGGRRPALFVATLRITGGDDIAGKGREAKAIFKLLERRGFQDFTKYAKAVFAVPGGEKPKRASCKPEDNIGREVGGIVKHVEAMDANVVRQWKPLADAPAEWPDAEPAKAAASA